LFQLLWFTALKTAFLHGSLFLFRKAYFSNEQLDKALHAFKPFSRSAITELQCAGPQEVGYTHFEEPSWLCKILSWKQWQDYIGPGKDKVSALPTDVRVCGNNVPDYEN